MILRHALHAEPQVRLRPVTMADADAMCRWMLDPAIASNIGLRSTPSMEKTRQWIQQATADETVAARAIEFNGRHVGNVVLDRIDRGLGTARLSIYIGEPDCRRMGVGGCAMRLVLREAFGAPLLLNKVWLTVHCRNVAAVNAYQRLGFQLEGVLRDEFVLDGRRINLFYMGLLVGDFEDDASAAETPY